MSRLRKDKEYNFGYSRFETLSGYVNSIFLIFVAFFILAESVDRLLDTPVIESDPILIVSLLGFAVNLLGLFFFHDHAHFNHST